MLIRNAIAMSEHPVVQEYLRAYNKVLDFKNKLSHVLMDKGRGLQILLQCFFPHIFKISHFCVCFFSMFFQIPPRVILINYDFNDLSFA